jgi:hypothetical protein
LTIEELDGIERNLQETWSSVQVLEDQLRVGVNGDTSNDRVSIPIDVRDRLYWNALSAYGKFSALALNSTDDNATRLNEAAENVRILSLEGVAMVPYVTGISREELRAGVDGIADREANLFEGFPKASAARALKDDKPDAA